MFSFSPKMQILSVLVKNYEKLDIDLLHGIKLSFGSYLLDKQEEEQRKSICDFQFCSVIS